MTDRKALPGESYRGDCSSQGTLQKTVIFLVGGELRHTALILPRFIDRRENK